MWCAGLGAFSAALTAAGLFGDSVGSGATGIAFVLALVAGFGALAGSLTETRPRNMRPARADARLRMVGLGGAGATFVLWALARATQN